MTLIIRRAVRAKVPKRSPATYDEAVAQAEARRLANTLRPFGAMRKSFLERESASGRWHSGSFDAALAAAVKEKAIRRLTFGFYKPVRKRGRWSTKLNRTFAIRTRSHYFGF